MPRAFFFLPAALLGAALLTSLPAIAEDSLRLVVIETTPKDAAAIRKLLADPAKSTDPEAIKPVLALRDLELHGDFLITSPWPREGRSQNFNNGVGQGLKMKSGGVTSLGVRGELVCHGPRFDSLELSIRIKNTPTTAHVLDIRHSAKTHQTGKWEERAAWGDTALTRMVWHYVTLDPGGVEAPANVAMKLEMALLKAPATEVKKALEAKPEDRDKAIKALRDRAKLVKEGFFWAQNRQLVLEDYHPISRSLGAEQAPGEV